MGQRDMADFACVDRVGLRDQRLELGRIDPFQIGSVSVSIRGTLEECADIGGADLVLRAC